jgi:hypothetical protein
VYGKYNVAPPWSLPSPPSTMQDQPTCASIESNVLEGSTTAPLLEGASDSNKVDDRETSPHQQAGAGQDGSIVSPPSSDVTDKREGRTDSSGNPAGNPSNPTRRVISRSLSPPSGKTGRPSIASWKMPIEEENQFRYHIIECRTCSQYLVWIARLSAIKQIKDRSCHSMTIITLKLD